MIALTGSSLISQRDPGKRNTTVYCARSFAVQQYLYFSSLKSNHYIPRPSPTHHYHLCWDDKGKHFHFASEKFIEVISGNQEYNADDSNHKGSPVTGTGAWLKDQIVEVPNKPLLWRKGEGTIQLIYTSYNTVCTYSVTKQLLLHT